VEIRILRRLFTEQEARLAIHLGPFPESPAQISVRAGIGARALQGRLEEMSRKGLIFRVRRGGETLYNAAPFMIGLYEYSVGRVDPELAALYREYYDAVYQDEMGASDVPGFKVLPVAEAIRDGTVLLPFESLREGILCARRISVAECICRKEARLTGGGCDRPLETCLSFGAAADFYIENGTGREIDAREALRIIEEADRAGLVHAGANAKHLSNICNCCPCCCASLKGITQKGHPAHKYMNALFEAVIDPQRCVSCGACVSRCPVGAISLGEGTSVDRKRCLGCGLCAGDCPAEALSLCLRSDRQEPFDRVLDMGAEILRRKGRLGGRA
jgi:Pyruvate/2-oxoacid:ferredoxin oxidoreductase delta subunit